MRQVKRKTPAARAVQSTFPFPVAVMIAGRRETLNPGDWLVFESTGEYTVVPDDGIWDEFRDATPAELALEPAATFSPVKPTPETDLV